MTNKGKIGIDLGTTYSCCGIFKNNKVDLVPYNEGGKTIPSYVYYNPDKAEIVVGTAAKINPKSIGHSAYDSKRFIGRKFNDSKLQNDMKHWQFKVIEGKNGEPLVELTYNKKEIELSANDISSEVLRKIKFTADQYYGQNPDLPTEAVVTVPAYFNNQQRQNTIEAAKNANLKVIKIINEPTAAAIAYAHQRIEEVSKFGDRKEEKKGENNDEETLLIYDFGGGTFDVSIIKINFKSKKITVLGTDGDSHLGGEDIDQNMVEYFLEKYKEETGHEMNSKQQFKLKKACENTKCLLSAENISEATVECETLEDEGIDTTLTIANFNDINKELFNKTMNIVDSALKSANLKDKDIDLLVLVGGSSRIPKVQKQLKEKFPCTIVCRNINPDEVVAYGACLYANLESMHFEVQDIITHTISTDIEKDGKTVLYPLIKKNTPIPYESKETLSFANAYKGVDHIDISVFEGEGRYPTDVGIKRLDSKPFKIPIKDAKEASYIIDTLYNVDENGVLTIEVKDRQTGKIEHLKIELK